MPQTKLARGLDLDGNDGSGKPPPGICKHKNYAAEDGRTGIDNQLYTVQGCNTGYMGHRGFYTQYANEQRRNGLLTTVVQISGIDDEKNDDRVYVTILHGEELPMPQNTEMEVKFSLITRSDLRIIRNIPISTHGYRVGL